MADGDIEEIEKSFNQLLEEQGEEGGHINYGSIDDEGNSMNSIIGSNDGDVFENPGFQEPPKEFQEIEMEEFPADNPIETSVLVKRRRAKSAKESSKGIEHILEDLPSRTVGRKRGARVADGVAAHGTIHRHNRLASIDQFNNYDQDATELLKEMTAVDGSIDNDHLRDLPVNMTLKKKVRSKAKEKEEDVQSKTIGNYSLWKFKMSIKWRHFKDDTNKLFTSGGLWRHHLKEIEGDFGTGVLSYFTFLRGIFLLSFPAFLLSFLFISVPQLIEPPPQPECNFTGVGLLTGENCITNTIMYQGYYTNETINKVENTYYNMPLAYLFTTFGYFLLCLIWLVRVTGVLFRENYIDAKEDSSHFISKVFCAWDFGTMSASAAQIQHKTIATDLKEVLAEQRRGSDHRTACEKFEVIVLRFISWIVYFSLVAAADALIYFTNKKFICDIKSQTQENPIIQDLALPLIVSSINLLLPYVIDWITYLEKYKYPRHRLYISVLRNFIFKMSILGVICAFWTSNNIESCDNMETNMTVCWETNLGQEIYRLVLVDFIFTLIFSTFCAEFLWRLIKKAMGHDAPEFSIANNVMDLIYGQTLCWIGVYFSPLLALINMIKYFILFYVKKVSLMQNCRPATERWRASQSQTLFNMVQLVSFILSTAFLAYVIFNETPSEACGPFRGQERAYDVVVSMVTELASTTGGEWLATVLMIVFNVWVLDAIVIFILILVIFEKNKSTGMRVLASNLEQQIAMEGKDKSLLLKWLQKMSGEEGDDGPSGSTPSSNNKTSAAGEVLLTDGVFSSPDFDIIEDASASDAAY